jgi:hypothetical protein
MLSDDFADGTLFGTSTGSLARAPGVWHEHRDRYGQRSRISYIHNRLRDYRRDGDFRRGRGGGNAHRDDHADRSHDGGDPQWLVYRVVYDSPRTLDSGFVWGGSGFGLRCRNLCRRQKGIGITAIRVVRCPAGSCHCVISKRYPLSRPRTGAHAAGGFRSFDRAGDTCCGKIIQGRCPCHRAHGPIDKLFQKHRVQSAALGSNDTGNRSALDHREHRDRRRTQSRAHPSRGRRDCLDRRECGSPASTQGPTSGSQVSGRSSIVN